jgi:hypothetical protein
MTWRHQVKIKHLLTEEEDHEAVQASMNSIADVLDQATCFWFFPVNKFRSIPEGDAVFGPVDYANKLLDAMYTYADKRKIWIE